MTRVIAVDWSGAKVGARRKIWLAEVTGGSLRRLENGRSRSEVIRHVIEEDLATTETCLALPSGS